MVKITNRLCDFPSCFIVNVLKITGGSVVCLCRVNDKVWYVNKVSVLISFHLSPLCSIDKVSKVASPVLVIHGTEDEVIDFSHGLAMYERCPRAVEPLWVEGAGHNDIELYAQYLDRLKQFISFELPTSWRELSTQARVHLNTLKKPPPYHVPASSLSKWTGLDWTPLLPSMEPFQGWNMWWTGRGGGFRLLRCGRG